VKSATLSPTTTVTPDLIRGKAFLCGLSPSGNVAEGSRTPDQVRGDDIVREVAE
jgi:hypothetical protein